MARGRLSKAGGVEKTSVSLPSGWSEKLAMISYRASLKSGEFVSVSALVRKALLKAYPELKK